MFYIVDDLEAPEPSTFQFHLHSGNEFTHDDQWGIRTVNQTSGVRIAFATPQDLFIDQTSETDPPSIGMEKKQWHLKAETKEKKKKQQFVAFLKTYLTRELSLVRGQAARVSEADFYGFVINGDKQTALFINSSTGMMTLNQTKTDAAMVVMYNNETTENHFLFVTDATYLEVNGNVLLQSENRVHYLVPGPALSKARSASG